MAESTIIRFRYMADDSPVWEGEFYALEEGGISVVTTRDVAISMADYLDRHNIPRSRWLVSTPGGKFRWFGLPLTIAD